MAIRLRRPGNGDLEARLAACPNDALTYAPIGGSISGVAPSGLSARRWTIALPHDAFDRGVEAIGSWSVHRGAGLVVVTDGPIALGTNVAMNAPLPFGTIDVTCRIVAIVDESDRFGFAYGTLSVHPERGEESFLVVRDGNRVRFDVQAVSAPRHPLARVALPLALRLQDAAVRRYLSSMERLVAS